MQQPLANYLWVHVQLSRLCLLSGTLVVVLCASFVFSRSLGVHIVWRQIHHALNHHLAPIHRPLGGRSRVHLSAHAPRSRTGQAAGCAPPRSGRRTRRTRRREAPRRGREVPQTKAKGPAAKSSLLLDEIREREHAAPPPPPPGTRRRQGGAACTARGVLYPAASPERAGWEGGRHRFPAVVLSACRGLFCFDV